MELAIQLGYEPDVEPGTTFEERDLTLIPFRDANFEIHDQEPAEDYFNALLGLLYNNEHQSNSINWTGREITTGLGNIDTGAPGSIVFHIRMLMTDTPYIAFAIETDDYINMGDRIEAQMKGGAWRTMRTAWDTYWSAHPAPWSDAAGPWIDNVLLNGINGLPLWFQTEYRAQAIMEAGGRGRRGEFDMGRTRELAGDRHLSTFRPPAGPLPPFSPSAGPGDHNYIIDDDEDYEDRVEGTWAADTLPFDGDEP